MSLWKGFVALLVLFGPGCAEGLESAGGAHGGGGAGGDEGSGVPQGCSETRPCDPGSACHNGACASGCNGDADCETSEYCALEAGQFCQPIEVPTCPQTACSDAQVCVDGLCGTQTGQQCGANPFTMADGCASDQICLNQVHVDGTLVESAQCYSLPPCSPDHSCPIGDQGARCSFGIMDGKDAVCVPGICLSAADCPTDFNCVRRATTDANGHCSNGAVGSLCATTADCKDSSCITLTAGLLGVCQ